MYIFASSCLIGLAMCKFYIPNELNQTANMEEIAELELLEEQANDFVDKKQSAHNIGWGAVIKNRCAMMALACIFAGTYNGNYWSPFIETYF